MARRHFKGKKVLTPASNVLLKGSTSRLLSREDQEIFHSITTNILFISSRSRPDRAPKVSFLSGRVREGVANKNDWENVDV